MKRPDQPGGHPPGPVEPAQARPAQARPEHVKPAHVKPAHRAEAALARALIAVARSLPPAAASDLGGAVARSIGPRLPVSRVADGNLRHAMPDLDAAGRRRVVRGVWDNLGRTVAELPHVRTLARTASGPGWEMSEAADALTRELAAGGGPVLLFSGHLGNWELLPTVAAWFGIELGIFYRAAANPLVDRMIGDMRSPPGLPLPMFAKGAAGARGAIAHLAGGGFLSMLVDQKMNDGIAVPFFGRPAWTAPAIAAFALRWRCPVVPAFTERLGPARFRIHVEPPLPLPGGADRAENIAALMLSINGVLERWIAAHPQSWLWLHRRWPKPEA